MNTTITARHCEITDALRERASSVTERLGTMAPRSVEAAVVFDQDGLQCVAELRLHISAGDVMVATGEAGDHRSALDRAEEKLRRQIERTSGRQRTSRRADAPQA